MAKNEAQELATMTDREITAYRSILAMSARCLLPDLRDQEKIKRHLAITAEIARGRGLI